MFEFNDIRPYSDHEVREVLQRLCSDDEFLATLVRFRFPRLPQSMMCLVKPLLRVYLKQQLKNVNNVYQFQCLIERIMDRMIATTTSSLTESGLANLDLTKPHLFISNHRDIALDPAFINYLLHRSGQSTVQIAIGDNLLTKPWVSDLMRLNRSFVVKRGATSKREKLTNSKTLSAYIQHSLHELGDHIWIAQREGRAKDGKDFTNGALISMLALNKAKEQDFADYIRQLRIVPVSISYEYDPCDVAKAQELLAQQQGAYEKQLHEDIMSISRGITGQKGRVHVHFSPVLNGDYANAKEVAQALDRAIIGNYQLMPTNYVAVGGENSLSEQERTQAERYFEAKTHNLSADMVQQLMAMYANPVLSQRDIIS